MNTNMMELNLNDMEMVNGGSIAKTVARIIGAIGTPVMTAVGGPLCGLAFGAISAVCNAAAEAAD